MHAPCRELREAGPWRRGSPSPPAAPRASASALCTGLWTFASVAVLFVAGFSLYLTDVLVDLGKTNDCFCFRAVLVLFCGFY